MKIEMEDRGQNKQENCFAWLIRIICYELKTTISSDLAAEFQNPNQPANQPGNKTNFVFN
jgi:hypothetical protein